MKHCPQCNRSYDDATDFCVDDGAPLASYGSFVSADVPTQVFTPVPAKAPAVRETGKLIYTVVGVMATVIIALVALLFYLASNKKNEVSNQDQTRQTNQTPEKTPQQVKSITQPDEPAIGPITESAARDLVVRWKNAQNMKSLSAYRACYAPTSEFIGIKRTPSGGREQLTFNSWMNDRGKMLRNVVEVQADIQNISIDGETAVAVFSQKWRSVNHCDIGEKTLRIKMFADGPKIVFEELKDPVNCS